MHHYIHHYVNHYVDHSQLRKKPSSQFGSCCEARVDDLLRRVLIVGEVIHQKRRDLLGINIVWGYRQSAMRIEWDYKGFHIYIYI